MRIWSGLTLTRTSVAPWRRVTVFVCSSHVQISPVKAVPDRWADVVAPPATTAAALRAETMRNPETCFMVLLLGECSQITYQQEAYDDQGLHR